MTHTADRDPQSAVRRPRFAVRGSRAEPSLRNGCGLTDTITECSAGSSAPTANPRISDRDPRTADRGPRIAVRLCYPVVVNLQEGR